MTREELITNICNDLLDQKALLNHLDSICGDGETGSNLALGAEAVLSCLNSESTLRDLGMSLNSAGCGTLGTIISFLLMKTDKAETMREALDILLETFRENSDAQVGDKTIADSLLPWIETATTKIDSGLTKPWLESLESSRIGMESTKDLCGKKGRGQYAGTKSCGTIDPGAFVTFIVLKHLSEYLMEIDDGIEKTD